MEKEPSSTLQKRGSASIQSSGNQLSSKKTHSEGPSEHGHQKKKVAADDWNIAASEQAVPPIDLQAVVEKEAALLRKILSYATVNEETDLSLTCRFFRKQIDARRTLPCVVRAKKMSTKFEYEAVEGYTVGLHQHQRFRFLVLTGTENERFTLLQVQIELVNRAWEEWQNRRQTSSAFPGPTRVYVDIKTKDGASIIHWERWDSTSREDPLASPYLGLVLTALSLSFKTLANGSLYHNYPSFEYLMQFLPSRHHGYFPDFDWYGGFLDRQTEREISYRPAKTLNEWKDYVPFEIDDEYNFDVVDVQEVPWYEEGYWIDDDDSYEYCWADGYWRDESTNMIAKACWRRVQGSSERGQLCIAQIEKHPSGRVKREAEGCPILPVAASEALSVNIG